MLNAGYKKEALQKCEEASKAYQEEYNETVEQSGKLYTQKENAVIVIKDVEVYLNSITNKPQLIEKQIANIVVYRKKFEQEVNNLEVKAKKNDGVNKTVAGAGVVAGVGVAALGPTVAMGIATTFGTASTGTAIATLTGAAQVNAALAWLGGGALTAGGAGMAGGSTFLAMAGPIGWAIGGTALVGSGLLANSKNKKIAAEAEQKTKEIRNEAYNLSKLKRKVISEEKAINELNVDAAVLCHKLCQNQKTDFMIFTDSEKDELIKLINSAEVLAKRIGVKIA